MNKVFKVGLIGCGHISETYFRAQEYFNNIRIVKCADINMDSAKKCAIHYNIEAVSVEEILKDKEILTIDINQPSEREMISNKISELENSLKQPITLMKNDYFPFFDTSISKKVDFVNSVSLLNIQSINDFEKKVNKKIETSIFRGNICIDGIDPWKEREWIGKTIKINNVSFKVEKNIPRCVAINLKPQTDDNSFNLLQSLKKIYNHFDMGIYLTALDDGEINIKDKINI